MSIRTVCSVALSMALLVNVSSCGTIASDREGDIANILLELNSNLRFVDFDDMDSTSCGVMDAPPGYIKADFNGDSIQDYAILALLEPPIETTAFNGRNLNLHEFWLILVTGLSNGEMEYLVYEEFQSFIPSGVGISAVSPGSVDIQHDSDEVVIVDNTGILVYFCEKSSKIIFWNGIQFVESGITD